MYLTSSLSNSPAIKFNNVIDARETEIKRLPEIMLPEILSLYLGLIISSIGHNYLIGPSIEIHNYITFSVLDKYPI